MTFFARTLRVIVSALAATVLAVPVASAAPGACQFQQIAQVPLHYAGAGLNLSMAGEINGKPATMLPDTGAGRTYLSRSGVERHGLRMQPTRDFVEGVAGKSRLYDARVSELAIGPVRARNLTLGVIGDTSFTPSFDAIAGAAYLLQSDLEFSLATKELRFFRPEGCGDAWLAYWDRNASVIPFRQHHDETPNPRFTVHINGVRLEAIIDSGAAITSISRHAAQRAGIALDGPRAKRVGHAGGVGRRPVANWIVTADTFKLGDVTVHHPEFDVIDVQPGADVLLGADFLRAHRVLFAMSQGKLYVSYLGGQPFDARREVRPWMREEAEAGNADAWLTMANTLETERATTPDPASALAYRERAAALGQRAASLSMGVRHLVRGDPQQAIALLRATEGQDTTGRNGALWLYLARLRAGQAQAGAELAARFEGRRDWPRPVVDYFLGKIESGRLLALADTPGRACFAANLVQLHQEALGTPGGAALPPDCASIRDHHTQPVAR